MTQKQHLQYADGTFSDYGKTDLSNHPLVLAGEATIVQGAPADFSNIKLSINQALESKFDAVIAAHENQDYFTVAHDTLAYQFLAAAKEMANKNKLAKIKEMIKDKKASFPTQMHTDIEELINLI